MHKQAQFFKASQKSRKIICDAYFYVLCPILLLIVVNSYWKRSFFVSFIDRFRKRSFCFRKKTISFKKQPTCFELQKKWKRWYPIRNSKFFKLLFWSISALKLFITFFPSPRDLRYKAAVNPIMLGWRGSNTSCLKNEKILILLLSHFSGSVWSNQGSVMCLVTIQIQ